MKGLGKALRERKGVPATEGVPCPCDECGRMTEAGPFAQAIQHARIGGRPMSLRALCPGCYGERLAREQDKIQKLTALDVHYWKVFRQKYRETRDEGRREELKAELIRSVYQRPEYEELVSEWEKREREGLNKTEGKSRRRVSDKGAGF